MELRFGIKEIKLLACHFEINPSFAANENKAIEIVTNITVNHKKQRRNIVSVAMSVTSDGKEQPFSFTIAYEGLFGFSKSPNKEDLSRIVGVNCAAIMLPYVRENVADLTRRAGIPPFHMDPVNFVSAYRRGQAHTEGEAIAQKKE